MKRYCLSGLIQAFVVSLLCINSHWAYGSTPIEIKVGGYLFAPFIQTKQKQPTGLTPDLIELLNTQQTEFNFVLVSTSPKRRYIDFERNVFDAIFFENKNWGWQDKPILPSKVFLSGGEVYITLNSQFKDQSFFSDLKEKSLLGILGYHYGFAQFNSDEAWLKHHFKIELVNYPSTLINQILAKKAQIGVITESYLYNRFKLNPSLKPKILISNKRDQEYKHTILVRENSPLTIEKINSLLEKIKQNGELKLLLKNYGLSKMIQ